MAQLKNDIINRLFFDTWRDVSSDVLCNPDEGNGITVQRGRKSEDTSAPPQECDLMLKNQTGHYTEGNPHSPWFFQLGPNTPHESALRMVKDTATVAASNGWGSTDTDPKGRWMVLPWSTSGGAASDYAKAAGKATHAFAAADSGLLSYLEDYDQREQDLTITLTLPFSNVGVGAVGTDILLRMQNLSTFYRARLLIAPDETVRLALYNKNGLDIVPEFNVDGLSLTTSQTFHYRVQCEGRTFRAKVWVGANREDTEPFSWAYEYVDIDQSIIPGESQIDLAGFIGVQSFVGGGNTNVPFSFSYDDIDIRMPLCYDEISEWPEGRDTSGLYRTVNVKGCGIKRRILQPGGSSFIVDSAMKYFVQNDHPAGQLTRGIVYYWPMDDGPQAGGANPLVGDRSVGIQSAINAVQYLSQGKLAEWLEPCIKMHGDDQLKVTDLEMPNFVAADGWMVDHVFKGGWSNDHGIYMTYGTTTLTCILEHAIDEIDVNDPSGSTVATYVPPFDGDLHHIRFAIHQEGANVQWAVFVDGEFVMSDTYVGTLGALHTVEIDDIAAHTNPFDVGHLAVYDIDYISSVNAWDALHGLSGEFAGNRMFRVAADAGYQFSWIGNLTLTQTMGPQTLTSAIQLLNECEFVDGGILYEQRAAPGFQYRTLESMTGRASWCTLSMANGELSPGWSPKRDDRYTRNKVIAKRNGGGERSYQQLTGRMSTAYPGFGGIGPYEKSENFNVAHDSQLEDLARWHVTQGTLTERRYPRVIIDLHRKQIHEDNPELYRRLLDLDVGDQITLADLDATYVFDDTPQIVIGLQRYITQLHHNLEVCLQPASVYRAPTFDGDSYFDAENTVTDRDMLTGTDTEFKVRSLSETWSTTTPYSLMLEGEEMTCTACTAPAATFVSAGTPTHGDNASVTPGTPASGLAGDVMVIIAAIRNAGGSANPNIPADYEMVQDASNVRVFTKYTTTNGEAPPQITFTGGSAGDTTTAVAFKVRGISIEAFGTPISQSNGSAQNIACTPPATPYAAPTWVFQWGWKQDDWTSVAAFSSPWAEAIDTSTTTGNDQGLVVDYAAFDGLTNGPRETSFVVTGGASAISKSGAIVFHVTQTMTVTRGVNGVTGLVHEAGTAVNIARPAYLTPM